jgi:hypothetical protein
MRERSLLRRIDLRGKLYVTNLNRHFNEWISPAIHDVAALSKKTPPPSADAATVA